MKITYDWLKDHLQTKNSENQLLDKLTDIGLEVEQIENTSADLDNFIVAKIIKTEKHPNADRLKVCDVDIGKKKINQSGLWRRKCKRKSNNYLCFSRCNNSKK